MACEASLSKNLIKLVNDHRIKEREEGSLEILEKKKRMKINDVSESENVTVE